MELYERSGSNISSLLFLEKLAQPFQSAVLVIADALDGNPEETGDLRSPPFFIKEQTEDELFPGRKQPRREFYAGGGRDGGRGCALDICVQWFARQAASFQEIDGHAPGHDGQPRDQGRLGRSVGFQKAKIVLDEPDKHVLDNIRDIILRPAAPISSRDVPDSAVDDPGVTIDEKIPGLFFAADEARDIERSVFFHAGPG